MTVQEHLLDELLAVLELGPGHDRDNSLGAVLLHVGQSVPATSRAADDHAEKAWRHLWGHIADTPPARTAAMDYSNWRGADAEIRVAYALRLGLLVGYEAATQDEVTAGDVVRAAKTAAFHVDADPDLSDWVGLPPIGTAQDQPARVTPGQDDGGSESGGRQP